MIENDKIRCSKNSLPHYSIKYVSGDMKREINFPKIPTTITNDLNHQHNAKVIQNSFV